MLTRTRPSKLVARQSAVKLLGHVRVVYSLELKYLARNRVGITIQLDGELIVVFVDADKPVVVVN